ncbi:hypothetical protein [Microbacterium gubbeenense]|uniref:hypothetical protein n=1 Tax=Microbacterium gubbeenense TaxID=159896 RepID=UPI003F9CD6E9
MTPAELRAAADQLTRYVGRIPGSPHDPDYLNAWAAAEAAARLADVIEYVEARDDVANYTVNDRLLRIARGETNEREKP